MTKSNGNNILRPIWLLICIAILFSITACGGSQDTSSSDDGSNTDTDTSVQIDIFTASVTSLSAGQSSILMARVSNSAGNVVSGATVSFAFITGGNNTGGTVVTLNGGLTDAGGKAYAVYTAGSTTTNLQLDDTIQATCDTATAAIVITRLATTATPTAGYQVTLSSSPSSLLSNQSSVITATVTSSGSAAANVPIVFSFITNESGGNVTQLGTTTDGSGTAIAVYRSGSTSPTADVQDTISASVNAGAAWGAVIITRVGSASSTSVIPGYIISITTDTTTVTAGQSTIVAVKVTDSTGNAQEGMTVTWATPIDNSGGSLTGLGPTDASGTAIALYTAGSASASTVVQDTIQASVSYGGYSAAAALIITRTGSSSVLSGYSMTVVASETTVRLGGSSIITATVLDPSNNPVEGLSVVFGFLTNNSGANITNLGSGVTDASGRAVALYTAGTTASTIDVQDAISATVVSGGYSAYGAVLLVRTGSSSTTTVPDGFMMSLTASSTSVSSGQISILTAAVTDGNNNPVSGLTVTFQIISNNSGANLTNAAGNVTATTVTGTTDAAGRAVAQYRGGTTSSSSTLQDSISASVSSGGYSAADAIVITRVSDTYKPEGYTVTLTPTPVSLPPKALSVLVARVYDPDGITVSGQTVTFKIVTNNSGAILTPVNGTAANATTCTGTTDSTGAATAVYTAGTNNITLDVKDAVQAYLATGEASAAIIDVIPESGSGIRIQSFFQTPRVTSWAAPLESPYLNTLVMANVTTNDLITPVANVTVTFSMITGEGTIIAPDGTNTDVIADTVTATTDNNGQAYVVFVRPLTGADSTVVRGQITGTINGGDAASVVFWNSNSPGVVLTSTATYVAQGGTSDITVTAYDTDGTVLSGAPVYLSFSLNNSSGTLSTYSGTTDGSGQLTTTYTAGIGGGVFTVYDTISVSVVYNGYTTTKTIQMQVYP